MGQDRPSKSIVIPLDAGPVIVPLAFVAAGVSFVVDSRTDDFGTLAAALGLYSAGLLGVFSILADWRTRIARRQPRDLHVGEKWARVVDRSVRRSLNGSTLSFALMVFGVLAPAFQDPVHRLSADLYPWIARCASALVVGGVVALAGSSVQTVRDLRATYKWMSLTAEDDAVEQQLPLKR